MNRWLFASSFCALLSTILPAAAAEPFALKEGDRVVFLGNTLIEREQRYGYWELALTARFPGVTFRNLGWSGDTVWGEARASFGSQADGFRELKEHVLALKPTVLIIGYGGNEAFDGPAGLPKFEKGLNDLLDALAPTKARVVLLSPPPHEKQEPSLPDPAVQNKNLALYGKAIGEIAKKRDCYFIDLFVLLKDYPIPLTEDGMHFTSFGYWCFAKTLESELASTPKKWSIEIDQGTKKIATNGVKVDLAEKKGLHFTVTSEMLPNPIYRGQTTVIEDRQDPAELDLGLKTGQIKGSFSYRKNRVLKVQGLPVGKYALSIDSKKHFSASEKEWAEGQGVDLDPDINQAEKLRQLIIEKNRLYFHRWRPQNVTYIFGFRKAEQGKNAIEIPQFDPLIAEKEAEIAKLRVPVPHIYEIKPE